MSRSLRDVGSIMVAIATAGMLGACNAGCGGRVTLGIQDDSGVGTIGTGGGGATAGTNPTTGPDATAGTDAMASTGGQSTSVDAASSPAAPPTRTSSRCSFTPDLGAGSAGATASAALVWARISQFLDNSAVAPPVGLPPQTTVALAAAEANAILDGHFMAGTGAPGLARFLSAWLQAPPRDAGVSVADAWSVKLVDPTATLTTLLAGPTADPHRIGILTDPQVLTARPRISGRGDWMAANLFCLQVPPPPPGLPVLNTGPLPPGMTRRQELESTLTSPACASCHQLMDPQGDSLEHFDAVGNYSDIDNGSPVDSSGTLHVSPMLTFLSIVDLAPRLAVSCPVAQCFANAVMGDAAKSTNLTFTTEEQNHVANAFADSNFSIRALVQAVVTTPSFLR